MAHYERRTFLAISQEKALREEFSKVVAGKALAALSHNRDILPGSGEYTIKCSCPNPLHKGGAERTASFYFSETTGRFFCFGCSQQGDAFDLITLLGGDGEVALEEARLGLKDYKIVPKVDVRSMVAKCLSEATLRLRTHLEGHFGKKTWNAESAWVEQTYSRLDEAMENIETLDPASIKGYFVQIQMNLARRPKPTAK
jgi:hypothetical protein